MQSLPMGMIEDIAEANGIVLENISIECLLFVYALVFKDAGEMLEKKAEDITKKSIKDIRKALEEIHIKFGHLKGEGKLSEKRYSDIEQISPILETALSHLIAALNMYDQTIPDPQQRPEKLRLRREALRLYGEDLLACRRYVTEINYQIGWWCKEEKAKDCLSSISAPPSMPTDIAKEKRRKQKFA
jgi:hypothetical protein